MALNKDNLADALETLFLDGLDDLEDAQKTTIENKAKAFAKAIHDYVSAAEVRVTVNASVTGITTCGAGPGTVTSGTATQSITNGTLA